MSNLPQMTDEQRRAALEKAAVARVERGKIRSQIKSGELKPKEAIDLPYAKKMRVLQFLMALPGVGKAKARLFMEEAGIVPNRRIGGLGVRQRDAVLEFASRYVH